MVDLNPQCFLFLVILVCCFHKPICPCTWASNQILLLSVLPETFILLPSLYSNVLIAIGQDRPVQKNIFLKKADPRNTLGKLPDTGNIRYCI